MKRSLPLIIALILPAAALASLAGISDQGLLIRGEPAGVRTSPDGAYRLEVAPTGGQATVFTADLTVTGPAGAVHRIPSVRGSDYLVDDAGRIVALEAPETQAVPGSIHLLDGRGERLATWKVQAPRNPALSTDGQRLILGDRQGVILLDLSTYQEERLPWMDLFAAGPEGRVVGIDLRGEPRVVLRADGVLRSLELPDRPRRVAWDGSTALVLTDERLLAWEPGRTEPETLFDVPAGLQARDLRADEKGIHLGLRRSAGDEVRGERVRLDQRGGVLGWEPGSWSALPAAPSPTEGSRGIPWPLLPNGQHPVGNTYGEFQDYSGVPYMHPGVDVMGPPNEPVYAVRSGVVKAVLTTSGEWHWRVAVGDEDTSGTCEGYLYAHLEESSIAVDVGDTVTQGQYLGDLVPWPAYGFTHCHFARIQQAGSTWSGWWLCTENPHMTFDVQSEAEAPVFENAQGSRLFAFCGNQSSSYQDPTYLQGAVDIVVHVGDRAADTWVCTVNELRYSIYPVGHPELPVVDDRLAVLFDMDLDTYMNGSQDAFLVDLLYKQDGTCYTQGDYDNREYYHILTNSNGDLIYDAADLAEAWDTAAGPDGDYMVEVTAVDAAGNEATQSMTVTTVNGNIATPTPTATTSPEPTVTLTPGPSPTEGPSPTPYPFELGVRIELTTLSVGPGDTFSVTGYLDNPLGARAGVPVYFALEAHGHLWFWPSWAHHHPPEAAGIDHRDMDVPLGTSVVQVLEPFVWPDTGQDHDEGLFWYGLMLDESGEGVWGNLALQQWAVAP